MVILDQLDLFSEAAPTLNFEGRQNVHSVAGLVCSFCVTVTLALYSYIGVERIIKGSNPLIAKSEIYN